MKIVKTLLMLSLALSLVSPASAFDRSKRKHSRSCATRAVGASSRVLWTTDQPRHLRNTIGSTVLIV